jgi:glycerophosphoryl diester phosphodiesterase
VRTTLLTCLLMLATLTVGAQVQPDAAPRLPSPPGVLVAHALGGIEHTTYSNSLDAFLANYQKGFRWFEVDLEPTADGELVCFHVGGESRLGMTVAVRESRAADVLSRCYLSRYTIMTFAELLRLTAVRPEVHIVTDTKGWDEVKVAAFARELEAVSPAVRARVVPQIYYPSDLALLAPLEARLGRFEHLIFTMYGYANISTAEVVAIIRETGARIVTVSDRRFNPELAAAVHRLGATVLVHTLNLEEQVAGLRKLGADGFYTDFYQPGVDPFAKP